MSSNLEWEPINKKREGLSDQLKFILRKKYGEPIDIRMNDNDVSYLTGLLHAGIKDAEKLLDAIDKYDEISVKEYY